MAHCFLQLKRGFHHCVRPILCLYTYLPVHQILIAVQVPFVQSVNPGSAQIICGAPIQTERSHCVSCIIIRFFGLGHSSMKCEVIGKDQTLSFREQVPEHSPVSIPLRPQQ